MDNGNLHFILRCGQCNKPFDKGELRHSSTIIEGVTLIRLLRIHSEETRVLLSVAEDRQLSTVSFLHFLRAREGSLRSPAAEVFEMHVQGN